MTIEQSYKTEVVYLCDGQQAEFPVPFPFFNDAKDIKAMLVAGSLETRLETPLTYAVDFKIYDASGFGGTLITFVPPAAGLRLIIYLDVLPLQELDLHDQGRLPAERLEVSLDKLTMLYQQLLGLVARAVTVPIGDGSPMDLINNIYALRAAIEIICQRAEDAARRAEGYGDCATLEAGLENLRGSWSTSASIPAGGELDLPVHYFVGRTVLLLCMDGLVCYPAGKFTRQGVPQYEEIGTEGKLSRTVKLLFDSPKGASWDALVIASNLTGHIEAQAQRAEDAAKGVEAAIVSAGKLAALAAVESVRPTIDEVYAARDQTVIAVKKASVIPGMVRQVEAAASVAIEAADKATSAVDGVMGGKRIVFLPGEKRPEVKAGAGFKVPEYIVGLGRLTVYLDGILCVAGPDAEKSQYTEVGKAGDKSSVIHWHDDVPSCHDIIITI